MIAEYLTDSDEFYSWAELIPDGPFIKVTQKCIDNGMAKCVLGCPIALAVNGNDNVKGSTVGKQTVTIVYEKEFITYALPEEVCDFVTQFDEDQSVEPFEFRLDVIVSRGTEEEQWHKKRREEYVG